VWGWGSVPSPEKFVDFWIVNVRIFVQTVLFVSSRKAGLIAFMGTPFPLSK